MIFYTISMAYVSHYWWNLIQEISPDAPWPMVLEYVSTFGSPLGGETKYGENMESKQRDDLTPYFLWLEGSQTFKGHIYFWYHPVMFIRWMWAVQWWGVPVRDFTFQAKNGSGNHVALPCSDATRYPLKKGKLRKDWDANPLTGHNPCTSRRIVTMKPYETIRLYDHSC